MYGAHMVLISRMRLHTSVPTIQVGKGNKLNENRKGERERLKRVSRRVVKVFPELTNERRASA